VKLGTRNFVLDTGFIPEARRAQGKETLFLTQNFNDHYDRAI